MTKKEEIVKKLQDNITYAIKSEPEYIDLEIVEDGCFLGVNQPKDVAFLRMPFKFTHIHWITALPNFDYFWCDDEKKRLRIGLETIAGRIRNKHKVYARLRK